MFFFIKVYDPRDRGNGPWIKCPQEGHYLLCLSKCGGVNPKKDLFKIPQGLMVTSDY